MNIYLNLVLRSVKEYTKLKTSIIVLRQAYIKYSWPIVLNL